MNRIKELAITSAVVAAVTTIPFCMVVYYGNKPKTPEPIAEVVEEDLSARYVEVGELINLTSNGDANAWATEPIVSDYQVYGPRDESCNLSFRKAGRYVVFNAEATRGRVSIGRTEVFVGIPKPEPGKTPDAVPSVVTPPVDLSEWDKKILSWVAEDNTPARKADAARLAIAFRSVAEDTQQQFEKGKLVTAADIVKDTKSQTAEAIDGSNVDWSAFNKSLNAELQKLAAEGKLDNMRQHVVTWREIATALENYAK